MRWMIADFSSAWRFADLRSRTTTSSPPTSPSCSPSYSLPSTPSVSSVSTSSTRRRLSLHDTEPQHQVSLLPFTGFLPLSLPVCPFSLHLIPQSDHIVTTPIGFASLGWKFYLVWASVAVSIIPSVYFFYPETTALSVEEIDKVFIDAPKLAESRRREKKANGGVEGNVEDFEQAKRKEEQLEQVLAENRGPQVHHT
jgi:hypothetical protein